MGYITTFSVYNDGCDLIKKYPKEFADKIYYACSNTRKAESFGLGNFANMIEAQKTRHADDHTCYVHYGNTVTEMNAYSKETEELMIKNREFFESLLGIMERNVRKLKSELKKRKETEKIRELTNKFLGIPISLFSPDGWVVDSEAERYINQKEIDFLYQRNLINYKVDESNCFIYYYKLNLDK